jgi:hypothetical protein
MSTEKIKKTYPDDLAADRHAQSPLVRTMPVRMAAIRTETAFEPLSSEEVQLADRATRRLHEQIRGFLSALPDEARNASGMARHLHVDRTTCQRLVFTASRPYSGLSTIDRLPGVRGLRQLVDAARKTKIAAIDPIVESLEAAIDRFDTSVRSIAPSQSSLIRRIAATPLTSISPTSVDADGPRAARQRLFESAAELTGRYSESWVAVYVYAAQSNQILDVARAHGLAGHVARPDAVPLTFHNFTSKRSEQNNPNTPPQEFRSLKQCETTVGRSPDSILRQFSSDPLPVVNSRQPGEYLVQAIDTEPSATGQPVDLMLATRNTMPHPASQPPGIEEVWAMINFPVRQMVFDVYLHRDLARQCIPSLDTHLWRPDFAAHVGDRWQTRFADGPRLEVLGQGIANAATPVYARHVELTEFLFDGMELDAGRFVGYRCTVQYPAWRTGYCMSFDFNASEDEPNT